MLMIFWRMGLHSSEVKQGCHRGTPQTSESLKTAMRGWYADVGKEMECEDHDEIG